MRFHLIPVVMAFIKKTNYIKYWQGCEERGIHAWLVHVYTVEICGLAPKVKNRSTI